MRFNYNSWASLLLYYLISFWLLLLPPCLSLTQFTKVMKHGDSFFGLPTALYPRHQQAHDLYLGQVWSTGSVPLYQPHLICPQHFFFFIPHALLQWAFQLVLFSFLFRSISFISLSHHSDLSTHSSDFVLPSKELLRLVNEPRVKSSSLYVD